jgi:glycosyltransferase involved in cell wall biosynthesis
MRAPASLSLIVSTFDQPHALAKALAGIQRQTQPPLEILVSDDGSAEPTRELVKKISASSSIPVKHIWQPHDGFRKTIILNQTVLAAQGEYLVFTDSDCVPHPKFIEDHAALAEKGFWVQGRRCFVKEEFVPEFEADKMPAWSWMLAGKITGASKGVRWPIPVIHRDMKQRGIIGCNMGFWREDILAVNGFDEDFSGWGGEDSDLGTRLYHLGRRRKFVYGRAITFHLNHPQLPRGSATANFARLAETIAQRKVACANGINRHR